MRTMEEVRLQVTIPMIATVTERGMRGRTTNMVEKVHKATQVHGLRRVRALDHGGKQYMCHALAFIPPGYGHMIPKKDWVNSEYAWVQCLFAMNCSLKSVPAASIELLEAFRTSSDYQWLAADAPTPAKQGDAA